MTDSRQQVTFEEFQRLVAQTLQVDESQVTPEASFMEDLYADSIRLVELFLSLGEKGISIPFDEAWNIKTVGDAYWLYSAHVSGSDSTTLTTETQRH